MFVSGPMRMLRLINTSCPLENWRVAMLAIQRLPGWRTASWLWKNCNVWLPESILRFGQTHIISPFISYSYANDGGLLDSPIYMFSSWLHIHLFLKVAHIGPKSTRAEILAWWPLFLGPFETKVSICFSGAWFQTFLYFPGDDSKIDLLIFRTLCGDGSYMNKLFAEGNNHRIGWWKNWNRNLLSLMIKKTYLKTVRFVVKFL